MKSIIKKNIHIPRPHGTNGKCIYSNKFNFKL